MCFSSIGPAFRLYGTGSIPFSSACCPASQSAATFSPRFIRAGSSLSPILFFFLSSLSRQPASGGDRKSTRLNSSHGYISYAVFCLKKKNNRAPCQQTFYPAPELFRAAL